MRDLPHCVAGVGTQIAATSHRMVYLLIRPFPDDCFFISPYFFSRSLNWDSYFHVLGIVSSSALNYFGSLTFLGEILVTFWGIRISCMSLSYSYLFWGKLMSSLRHSVAGDELRLQQFLTQGLVCPGLTLSQ
jgi:hypothetical protein